MSREFLGRRTKLDPIDAMLFAVPVAWAVRAWQLIVKGRVIPGQQQLVHAQLLL